MTGVGGKAKPFVMIKINHLVGKVTNDEAFPSGTIVVSSIPPHGTSRFAVFAKGNTSDHSLLNESPITIVLIEFVRLGVVSFKNIGKTVLVKVEDANA